MIAHIHQFDGHVQMFYSFFFITFSIQGSSIYTYLHQNFLNQDEIYFLIAHHIKK